jgi:hypothetical protein
MLLGKEVPRLKKIHDLVREAHNLCSEHALRGSESAFTRGWHRLGDLTSTRQYSLGRGVVDSQLGS